MDFIKYSFQFILIFTLALGQFADIPDTTYAMSGSSIGIPIQIEGLENFEGSSMTLTYSGEILTAVNVVLNSDLIGANYAIVSNVDESNTVLLTIWAQDNPLFSGSGIIAYIQFTAEGEPGESSIINFTDLWINDSNQLENSDGGVVFIGLSGCTDEFACNYDEDAFFEDGSCDYLDCNEDCGGNATMDCAGVCDDNPDNDSVIDCAGVCDDIPDNNNICGCTDVSAMNCTDNADLCETCIYGEPCDGFYNPDATFDDGSCEYIPPEWFQFNQSMLQAFYYFYDVYDVDSLSLESLDWVAAFKCLEWNADEITCSIGGYGECVGSRIWNLDNCVGGGCDVPVMGYDGEDYSAGYMEPEDIPAFVIYDKSEGAYFSAIPVDSLNQPINEPWTNTGFFIIPKLITAEFIGLKNENFIPVSFNLYQNYPNPFNPVTNLIYELTEPKKIELAIFDLQGRKIALLAEGFTMPGEYHVVWHAGDLASGIYFANLVANGNMYRRKMVLLK